jgi:phosphoribosylformylglycinamidine synthase
LIDKEEHITTQWFKNEGDTIILVGSGMGFQPTDRQDANAASQLGGSRYLKACHGLKVGPPPRIDLAYEIKIQNAVRVLIREGVVKSAHDCSEGGLAVALAECCFNPERLFGVEIDLKAGDTPATTALFNESQSRIVISVGPEKLQKTMSMLQERQIPFQQLGRVGGDQLRIRVGNEEFSWPVGDLYDDWWNAIRRAVESDLVAEGIPSL